MLTLHINSATRRILSMMSLTTLCALTLACNRNDTSHHKHASSHSHHATHETSTHGNHQMHHRFEDADKWAREFDDPKRDPWQMPAHVTELLELSEGMSVADIGAGTGYFIEFLSKSVGDTGQVFGLDIETDMVRYMNERIKKSGLTNAVAKQVQAHDPLLTEGSLDRILIVDTWHHIGDRVDYAQKLASAMRPEGFVAIVDFTQESPVGPPKKHRLMAEDIVGELTNAGLKTSIVEEKLPYQYVVIGRIP